ncbi:sensor histidine kinase [Nocardia panacis]|uniref:histidine kinase n=1 Tax=Nocardia panacis TaxID=2340916 RepID=A0A3A4KSI0_9NOCA|nr:HAMP domain-containing sensor histidine kinase [Nocardia panacis]RJO78950.1 sensor histidine kinase [Nocardia panacis]
MTILRRIIIAELVVAFVVGIATIIPLSIGQHWQAASFGIASVVLISLIARPLAEWALAPASAIRNVLMQLERGEIGRLNAHNGPPEIRRVIASINTAVEGLMTQDGHKRIVEADLAHQLRTTLQLLEARIDRLSTFLNDEGSATLAQARDDFTRLHDILTEKLDNANSGVTAPLIEIDVRDVVMERLEAWSDVAAQRGSLTLRPMTIDSAMIVTQRGTLAHLLDILLDNAIKHSPEHHDILLSTQVSPGGEQVTIRVIDEGPGMIAAQWEHAVERGWQAKPGDGPGRGLGLSIANVLAKSNRGRLTLGTAPSGRGLEVCIDFPVVLDRKPFRNTPGTNGVIPRAKTKPG